MDVKNIINISEVRGDAQVKKMKELVSNYFNNDLENFKQIINYLVENEGKQYTDEEIQNILLNHAFVTGYLKALKDNDLEF